MIGSAIFRDLNQIEAEHGEDCKVRIGHSGGASAMASLKDVVVTATHIQVTYPSLPSQKFSFRQVEFIRVYRQGS